jgi:predicted transcriptional regulator
MTRRSSQRALAREIYRQMVEERAARPLPDPPPQAGIQSDPATPVDGAPGSPLARGRAEETAPSLTEKARALYEHSAVPVAEIASLAGVTERTVYKYAARENWTPRYRWSAAGGRPRGARWRPQSGLAPVKGAGGRFIRRAEAGQPVATGLKAADPRAAAQAGAVCGEAAALAHAAEEKAKMAQLEEARFRAMEATADALHEYNRYLEERDRRGQARRYDRAEQALFRVVDLALQRWEWLEARQVGDH